MSIDILSPAYQPPKIENKPVKRYVFEHDLNTDFEENIPQQVGIIHQLYERPEKEYLQELPELHTQVDSQNLVQRYLHEQADLVKILKIILRKY